MIVSITLKIKWSFVPFRLLPKSCFSNSSKTEYNFPAKLSFASYREGPADTSEFCLFEPLICQYTTKNKCDPMFKLFKDAELLHRGLPKLETETFFCLFKTCQISFRVMLSSEVNGTTNFP